jgi:ketosteroid isomerase-like protein
MAMSRENVEVVRGVYDEISHRLDVSPEHFDPEFVMDMHEIADLGVHRGLPAAREVFRQYATTFDDFRVDLEEVIHADDERVVVALRDGGRVKGSDLEVWNRYFDVWTFRAGKAIRMSAHTDRARALEAAGLQEEPGSAG